MRGRLVHKDGPAVNPHLGTGGYDQAEASAALWRRTKSPFCKDLNRRLDEALAREIAILKAQGKDMRRARHSRPGVGVGRGAWGGSARASGAPSLLTSVRPGGAP
jgi:hypothetical protein